MIEGTVVWVPIKAKLIQDDQFEIVENVIFDNLDINELYEFFPGDIVELEQFVFEDGTKGKVAKKLISKGQWSDRKYLEFKFKATLGLLSICKSTIEKYKNEIERIKKDSNPGEFFYPSLLETVEKLFKLEYSNE